jgi:hypothetical protein
MGKTSTVLGLCGLIAGALVLGFALCFPFFSFLPLIWAAGLAVAFVLYFVGCVALGREVVSVGYLVVGLSYSVVFVWLVSSYTGVERVERYECEWKVDAKGVEIDLSPVGGFGWSRVASTELADHLRKDQPPMVEVDVPIIRDFGSVRARGLIQRVDDIPVREP